MGLLDSLGGGGLLPFSDRWAPVIAALQSGQFDPQGMNSGGGLFGGNGGALPYTQPQQPMPQLPPPINVPMPPQPATTGQGGGILAPAPMQPPAPQNAPASPAESLFPSSGGIGDRLLGALGGLVHGGSPLGGLSNAIQTLTTGQPTDPMEIRRQALTSTYDALRKIMPEPIARAATLNPEILKTIAPQIYQKPSLQETGTDPFSGQKSFSLYDPNKLTLNPIGPGGVGGAAQPNTTDTMFNNIEAGKASGLPVDMLLQNVPNSLRDGVAALIKGKAIPTYLSMRGQARDMAIRLAHAIDPNFDETTIPMRQTFAHGMAQTTPSSYGGQKLLLNTALQHYGELSDALVDLHNTNGILTSLPGSGIAANLYNSAANSSSKMGETVNKLEDISQKASGEVGKLYSGSAGGGQHEREATAGRFSKGNTPNQSIGGLEAARNLILDKLNALQNQRDQAYGATGENVYPLLDKETKAALAKIDENIAKLRGQPAQNASPQQPPAPGAQLAPDGKWYVPDPQRPGKYLMVK